MRNELAIKSIYEDFISKVVLNKDEITVLNMYLNNESYTKIGEVIGTSDRSVGRMVVVIKKKYEKYKQLELAKLNILLS